VKHNRVWKKKIISAALLICNKAEDSAQKELGRKKIAELSALSWWISILYHFPFLISHKLMLARRQRLSASD